MENSGKGIIVRMEGNNERLVNSASMIAINKDCTQTCVVLRVYDRGGMEFFVDRINELKSCVWHPCVIATLQIERRLTKIKEQLQDHKHHLEAMERTAGLYKAHRLDPEYKRGRGMLQPWNSKYFETLGSELTSVKSDVLYQQYKCSRFLDMLGFLDHVAAQLDDCPEFRMKSRFMRSTISGYEERSRYLSARAEATMQTVGRHDPDSIHANSFRTWAVLLPHVAKGQSTQPRARQSISRRQQADAGDDSRVVSP